jgi:deazaflavin-dependent oxidoreductase (nitroreductase family)
VNKFFLKIFMGINTFIIRVTKGRLGSRLGTQTVLLLHTRGRKSGKPYVTPIAYFHIEGYYFLVGSNWGKDQNAQWYHNLLVQEKTTIEVNGKSISVEAYEVNGVEYDRLWKYATEQHPPYLHYMEMTQRHIPIVILQPMG